MFFVFFFKQLILFFAAVAVNRRHHGSSVKTEDGENVIVLRLATVTSKELSV